MNVIWSKFVQGANTLYYSRRLRFSDCFAPQYTDFFSLDKGKELKILEIGCGPGALSGALKRWYPEAEVVGVDRDTEFIRFAGEHEPGVRFVEGDATALPFADASFDVTISNTVSEHVDPLKFYGEQHRVLKPGGICLVLSSCRSINQTPSCLKTKPLENDFWEKVNQYDNSLERFSVCQYPMTEAELPAAMESHGFSSVITGYATVDLTPDCPKYSCQMAIDMINANRYSTLDAIATAAATAPERFSQDELQEVMRLANERFDARLRDYEKGIKHWDTNVLTILMVRGIKR